MNTSTRTRMYQSGDVGTVVVEATFHTDQADLWDALTDPDRLRRWIADVSGDLRDQGVITLAFTSGWTGTGTILECREAERLVVLTTDDDGAETTTITAELTSTAEGTVLRVEETGLKLSELHFHGAGWQVHVEDLAALLEGRTPDAWHPRWQQHLPAFENARIEAPA